MIARKVCPFPLNDVNPVTACTQSSMLVRVFASGSNRTCITGQFVKGTRRG
jgi:hypothetical protein